MTVGRSRCRAEHLRPVLVERQQFKISQPPKIVVVVGSDDGCRAVSESPGHT